MSSFVQVVISQNELKLFGSVEMNHLKMLPINIGEKSRILKISFVVLELLKKNL